jgi:hypothetical protein
MVDNPRVGDLRLDWCREWSRNCGKAAADEFCRRQGFAEAASFARAPRIGERTKVIGSGQICNNPSCDGFASITCRRSAAYPALPPPPRLAPLGAMESVPREEDLARAQH